MISKNQIKKTQSLQQKKFRNKYGLFIVEGTKSVQEFLKSSFELDSLFYTDSYPVATISSKYHLVTNTELKKISALKKANNVLAIFKVPNFKNIKTEGLILALDAIKDPGNLGTIIRLGDWFGIAQIVCSKDTVDCYNPKVVQASMGSLTRVQITYTDLQNFITNTNLPVFTSLMDGDNIYKTKLPKEAIIIMGNEANGISNEILTLATNTISIPKFGDSQQTESLNVSTATAIILSEFKR